MTTALDLLEKNVRKALNCRFIHTLNGNVYSGSFIDRGKGRATIRLYNETCGKYTDFSPAELGYLELIED